MVQPSFEEFCERAHRGNLIPVYREFVFDMETPLSLLEKLSGSEHLFLLESAEGGERWGRFSYLGVDPFGIFRARGSEVEIFQNGKWKSETVAQPLERLRELMAAFRPVVDPALPAFFGGAVGFLGYDYAARLERLPSGKPDDVGFYDAYYLITDTLVIVDRIKNRLLLVANAFLAEGADQAAAYAEALEKLAQLAERLEKPLTPRRPKHLSSLGTIASNTSQEEFMAMVQRCRDYIERGDAFQIVISQRFTVETDADPIDLYRALRSINPSPYLFFFRLGEFKVVGSSPELFVRLTGDSIDARPIGGTVRRGESHTEDAELAERLANDPKEIAEHVMLVDMARNDLGRVSAAGTVHVNEFKVIEKYSHVMHIVSNIRSKLAPGKDAFDVVASSFPVGTMSGAPKIRAMEIIHELEPVKRGLYAGCVGWFGFAGNMDQAIVIRTFLIRGKRLYMQAGAGIVHDSVPERENMECWNKARALMRAVELAERGLEL